MKEPVSYEEWLLTSGSCSELGTRLFITDRILREQHKEIFDKIFDVSRAAFQRVIFDIGAEPISVKFSKQHDASLRANEIDSMIKIFQGASLEQYAAVVSAQVRDFYGQVKIWESKSLWQYLKWWVKRRQKE